MRPRSVFSPWCGVLLLLLVSAGGSAQPPETWPSQDGVGTIPLQARFPRPRSDREPALKTLTGQVVNKEGQGLAQAVVHLKNKKTLEVRTHISNEEGNYVFRGLDRDVDYAVDAEYRGAASATKTVISFDNRSELYLVLEVDTAKQ